MTSAPSDEIEIQHLKYPTGRYDPPPAIDVEQRATWIRQLEALPAALREAVADLTQEHLNTPYREGGWTVRQMVHHYPDSHMNAYVRFRLALTEDSPTIKPYAEAVWAELPDAKSSPISPSLSLLEALHERWVLLLRSLSEVDFNRTFRHPELGVMSLNRTLGLYAWHSGHHVAQIRNFRMRKGW